MTVRELIENITIDGHVRIQIYDYEKEKYTTAEVLLPCELGKYADKEIKYLCPGTYTEFVIELDGEE